MEIAGQFPHVVREIENEWIPLSDGCKLAARMWVPNIADTSPVPAVLEYLPYRKRGGTEARDALTHPYLCGHGYVCLRVDMRGNGESDGVMFGEYLLQEQEDALEVIDWIVAQPWCDGNVGMMGISWGGFNGLQVAARQPEALKAIISLCSTDDRYADDIHYKGGCLLGENMGWGSTMLAYSSRPPDPAIVGDRWRDMWFQRLEAEPQLAAEWLAHQHYEDFWKHGSICEDFGAIKAAVLAVGGWGDAYSNAIPRMLSGLTAPCCGITGPWHHKYPHFAVPEPRMGFLQEALRWWDHWLKGEDTGVTDDPLYRAYMMDSVRPQTSYAHRSGRWIAEDTWPSTSIEMRKYALNSEGLCEQPDASGAMLNVNSPQDTGQACGEFCVIWLGAEMPGDQRVDDIGSLVFDSQPLDKEIDIFGAPVLDLVLECDKPQANIAVRLNDVAPDGSSTRVTWGVMNLCHRNSRENPETLVPGERFMVTLQLDDIAWVFPAGHRLRVAVSTAYWPMIWPSPEVATVSIITGESAVMVPVRKRRLETLREFSPAEAAPARRTRVVREGAQTRTVEKDLVTGETVLQIIDDFGEEHDLDSGLTSGEVARETYRIHPDDPLCARDQGFRILPAVTVAQVHDTPGNPSRASVWRHIIEPHGNICLRLVALQYQVQYRRAKYVDFLIQWLGIKHQRPDIIDTLIAGHLGPQPNHAKLTACLTRVLR